MTRQQRHRVLARALDSTDVRQLDVWATSLARTRGRQVAIIRDLLVHACADDMLETDRRFAVAALRRLARTQEAAA